jgi:putative FmdB family regulatory protein
LLSAVFFDRFVMPFYEYQCAKCGHEEEVLQKISDKLLKKCPECGKMAMKKRVSAAAFRLKGGGWYETDFKSGDKKNVAGDAKADSKAKGKAQAETKASTAKKSSGGTTKAKKVKS